MTRPSRSTSLPVVVTELSVAAALLALGHPLESAAPVGHKNRWTWIFPPSAASHALMVPARQTVVEPMEFWACVQLLRDIIHGRVAPPSVEVTQ